MNNIPNEFLIYNISEKTEKDYNKNTICGYKKTDIITALEKTIILNNIEESIFWSCELIASGQFNEKIWEKLFILYSKNINISNSKVSTKILNIYSKFNTLKTKYNSAYELEIRNDQEIRNTIADLITVLTLAQKNNYLSTNKNFPKVSLNDLTTDGIKRRVIAQDMNSIHRYMSNNEPIEVKIALNEILSHLQNNNQQKHKDIFYWIKWLIKIESKLPNKKFICNERDIKEISSSYKTDWTWILWEIIFTVYKSSHRPLSEALYTLKSLYEMYKINYKKSTRTNKMYLIYNAILIISLSQTNQIDWNNPVISVSNYSTWIKVCANINTVYKKIAMESNTTYSTYMSANQETTETSLSSQSLSSYNDGYITNKLMEQQNYINRIIQEDDNINPELNEINQHIETTQEYHHPQQYYQQPQQPQQQYHQQYHQQYQPQSQPQLQQQYYQKQEYNDYNYPKEEGMETRRINIEQNKRHNYRTQSREEYHRPVQQFNPHNIPHNTPQYRQSPSTSSHNSKKSSKKKSSSKKKNDEKNEEIDEKTLKIRQRMSYLYLKPPPPPKPSSPLHSSYNLSKNKNKNKNKFNVVSDMYMNQTTEDNEIQLKNIIID